VSSLQNVQIGPVTSGSCPPPTEIVVIEAPKVFDFAFQEERLERAFTVEGLSDDAVVLACEIRDVNCCEVRDRRPLNDGTGLVEVTLRIDLCIRIVIRPAPGEEPVFIERIIRFQKRVLLCAPDGTDVTCDVQGNCLCTLQPDLSGGLEPNLFCRIHLCISVTASALVKLLVPIFGMVLPRAAEDAISANCPPIPPAQCVTFTAPSGC
jgi:hypothetical protein